MALVSLVAFLGVVALAEALHGVGTATRGTGWWTTPIPSIAFRQWH